MARCVYCNGSGRVSEGAQPGYKESVGWGMVVCRQCGGSGVDARATGNDSGGTPVVKAHPVVWVFAIVGAIFGSAIMTEFGVNALLGALVGFVVLGASAGILMRFRVGRRILIGMAVFFVAMLALGAYISK